MLKPMIFERASRVSAALLSFRATIQCEIESA
jgi:hypothetical protein